jgi:hypothetical protein
MCRVLRGLTEWKAVIVVSFLRIIVRANFIHPEFDWFFSFILHIRNIKGGSKLSLEMLALHVSMQNNLESKIK